MYQKLCSYFCNSMWCSYWLKKSALHI